MPDLRKLRPRPCSLSVGKVPYLTREISRNPNTGSIAGKRPANALPVGGAVGPTTPQPREPTIQALKYVSVHLLLGDTRIPVNALLDSGASASFINVNIVDKYALDTHPLSTPLPTTQFFTPEDLPPLIDRFTLPVNCSILNKRETLSFFVASHCTHDMVLGLPWIQANPSCLSTALTTNSLSLPNPTPPHIPAEHMEFQSVFSEIDVTQLPPHRPCDLKIELTPDSTPPFGPIYSLSPAETTELKNYLRDNLAKGFIRPSTSSSASPIMFTKKSDGTLRPVVDYRRLNALTQKNKYPLPLISQLFESVRGCKYFTKLDLRGAYNLIRVAPGCEPLTAFRTRFGLFEYLVMPFGLVNAPATFQAFINTTLHDILDIFTSAYIDDILIFSRTHEEHIRHVNDVLRRLRDAKLFVKLEKCRFHQSSVPFLGHVISAEGISMDPSKAQSIKDWPCPRTVKQVQSFIGLANYYRRFIANFSALCAPLNALTKKDTAFEWTPACDTAFQSLKQAFCSSSVLIHPNYDRPFVLEADASGYAIGAVLSQLSNDGHLHPVDFYSRTLTDPERNYPIYDQELLAIVASLKHWRHHLMGAPHVVTVYTDHKNLSAFSAAPITNYRHARWSLDLNDYRLLITYRPGRLQIQADALSRRADYVPPTSVTDRPTPIVPPAFFSQTPLNAASLTIQPLDPVMTDIAKQNLTDPFYQHICLSMKTEATTQRLYRLVNGFLYRDTRLYIPPDSRLDILFRCHDCPIGGHFGYSKTYHLATRTYFWPGMAKFVKSYVTSCETCARTKSNRHRPYGLLQPLPVAPGPWTSVTLDFITDLPPSVDPANNTTFDSILVVVDRFTKMSHFVPCHKAINAETTATLFLASIFKIHGTPLEIISDRGPQFDSAFWKSLFNSLNVKIKLSTAYHPQTDGQSERTNQTLETYLRCFVTHLQTDWTTWLPLAEFSYNSSLHSATQSSPFMANYGYHPRYTPAFPGPPGVIPPSALAAQLATIQSDCAEHLARARILMAASANKSRKPPPTLKVGDSVWLLNRNITSSRPSKKLDYRKLGPYPIVRQISAVVFELLLPPTLKLHPVFHVSLLEPYIANTIPGRYLPPESPVIVDGVPEFEVQAILDSKFHYKKLFYLVQFADTEPEWITASNLPHCQTLLDAYHLRYPDRPRPPSVLP